MTAHVPFILQTLAPLATAAGRSPTTRSTAMATCNGSHARLEACDALDGLRDSIVNHTDACTAAR